ncbi:RNA methyltransferase [Vibrio tubiashii]|uniref:RNA methyltransferase n=1 Tax=Vibrio tubiashii ATCC 19109 TaxID=1051646 RepID=F9T9L5_9VIBR|nr:RNA methyltransferase [Vibrio tubiashii]AIW15608.1 RNA methyltransferase [Vibrio tubiashii ATCC 19109]EGU51188.1 RNA methyltransferase, TrmH family [Vibrio tubiashii ATCC 19109]EIF02581.1 RNA methyltransferase, TrmH family [Vibrio tubiashii NCIMB 1337 = ATCC 19106]
MISKNQLKLLRALGQKKQRKAHGLFLVQGEKNVLELANSALTVKQVFATPEFLADYHTELSGFECIEASLDELTKASTLVSNNAAIAVVEIPTVETPKAQGLMIALDGVSDPGNLGTIIRVADWYGIKHIVASTDCADPYNPKTISATMGSFGRVTVSQLDLPSYLEQSNLPVYGAFLEGESVHKTEFAAEGILLMGSESHGIREQAAKFVTDKITIPAFGGAESLNVAMATGIIIDNLRRQHG